MVGLFPTARDVLLRRNPTRSAGKTEVRGCCGSSAFSEHVLLLRPREAVEAAVGKSALTDVLSDGKSVMVVVVDPIPPRA